MIRAMGVFGVPATAGILAIGFGFCAAACSGDDPSAPNPTDDGGTKVDGGDGSVVVPTGDVCSVAKKGTAGILLRGTLLLPEGEPTAGEVALDAAGKITCVGECAAGAPAATVIDCGKAGVISPSLVNAHDHTDYNVKGPYDVGTTRWTWRNGWRTGALTEKSLPSMPKVKGNVESAIAELRFVFGGSASIVGSGGIDGLLRNLATFPKNADTADLASKTAVFDTFPLNDQSGTITAPTCDPTKVVTPANAFRGGNYVPHVSEGIAVAANNEFLCLSQSTVGIVTERTAMIHSVGLGAADANVAATAKAKVIWSPRSNIVLYGNTAPISLFKSLGITIAMGTDWLPSGSMNMLREIACASSLNEKYFGKALSDRDLFDIVTKNGGIAAGYGTELGQLKVGFAGDIAVFDARAHAGFRAVIDATTEDVRLVIRGGKALYGDAALVDAIAPNCEASNVCGIDRKICLADVKGGVKLADIDASVKAGNYPLYFCRGAEVTKEPSCIPYRDAYPNGTSATDRDGDGVADGTDNCPDVFNPPRPMDGDKQSDADTDTFGDACDKKPLDTANH